MNPPTSQLTNSGLGSNLTSQEKPSRCGGWEEPLVSAPEVSCTSPGNGRAWCLSPLLDKTPRPETALSCLLLYLQFPSMESVLKKYCEQVNGRMDGPGTPCSCLRPSHYPSSPSVEKWLLGSPTGLFSAALFLLTPSHIATHPQATP